MQREATTKSTESSSRFAKVPPSKLALCDQVGLVCTSEGPSKTDPHYCHCIGLINDNLYSFVRENLDQRYLVAIDLRRSGTEKVEYDFSDVVQGTGELVVASVNLYDPYGTLRDAALGRPIKMDKVPLMPSGAIVLKLK